MWPNVLQRVYINNRKKEVPEGERKVVRPAGASGPGSRKKLCRTLANQHKPALARACRTSQLPFQQCCIREPLFPKGKYGLPNATRYLGLDPGTKKRTVIGKSNKVWGLVNYYMLIFIT